MDEKAKQNYNELNDLINPNGAPAAPPTGPPQPAAPSPATPTAASELKQLMNLLGPNAPPTRVPPTGPVPVSAAAAAAMQPAARAAALSTQQRLALQQQQQARAAAAAQQHAVTPQQQAVLAASRAAAAAKARPPPTRPAPTAVRQQAAALPRAPVAAQAAGAAAAAAAASAQRMPAPPVRNGAAPPSSSITDELQAYLDTPTAAAPAPSAPVAQARASAVFPGNPALANRALPPAPQIPGARQPGPPQGQAARQQQGQRGATVTQEQVIVGHFCRHALGSLANLTTGLPNARELQTGLKMHIKRLWSEWVVDHITKTTLLESVALFVKKSCPAAAETNVITEFRAWYHHQLEAQRRARGSNGQQQVPGAPRQAIARGAAVVNNRGQSAAHAMQGAYQYPASRAAGSVAAMGQGMGMPGVGQGRPGAMPNVKQQPRRPPPKAPPPRTAAKSIPMKTVAGKTVPRNPNAVSTQMQAAARAKQAPKGRAKVGVPAVGKGEAMLASMAGSHGRPQPPPPKRQLTPAELAVAGAAAKKPRPPPKKPAPKGGKAQLPNGGVGVAVAGKGTNMMHKPGMLNVHANAANRPHTAPGGGAVHGAAGGVRPPGAPPNPAVHARKRGVDDELNFVTNIVDIDHEQNNLVGDVNQVNEFSGGDSGDYSPDMLLVGHVLKNKIEKIMRRNGLTSSVSKDTMELIALAARERLAAVIESVRETATARVELEKPTWETHESGPDVFALMKKQRDDEERDLVVQSEMRTARFKKEEKEKAAKADKSQDEKSAKDAAAAAEQKRKAKATAEKKRIADSSQRNALDSAMTGIMKNRKKKRKKLGLGLGALSGDKSLSKSMASSAASSASLKSNPSGAGGPLGAGGEAKDAQMGAAAAAGGNGTGAVIRPALTLRDCLEFMSGEPNMRQSDLVYKWYARLGAPRLGDPVPRAAPARR